MAERKRLHLNLTNTDDLVFRSALKGYLVEINESTFIMGNEDLGLKVSGKNVEEAAELLKEAFIDLVNDIGYKSKYAPLSERERKKLNIIRSICEIGN